MASSVDPVSCIVRVIDVNEDPIAGASVFLGPSTELPLQAVTNTRGETQFHMVFPAMEIVLSISHFDFVRERVVFTDNIVTGAYNNPLLQRVPGVSANDISLIIHLGRYSSAPIHLLSYEELKDLATKSKDLRACVVEEINGGTQLSYRDTHMFFHTTRCAEAWLTPDLPPQVSGKPAAPPIGWGRFRSISVDVDPSKNGRLFWIEATVPSASSPQALSALVWSPNYTSKTPAKSIDIIFFYCPSTDTQTASYPYGLVMFKNDAERNNPAIPDQSYMSIGSRYLQKEHALIYTLAARNSSAIIIMPLNRKGAWDALTAQEGVWRLCKEVALFLHRECRTSNLGAVAFGSDIRKERCGGSLRDVRAPSPEAEDFGTLPLIRKLVVAYFSAGAYGAKSCMDFWSLKDSLDEKKGAPFRYIKEIVSKGAKQRFPAKLWGCENGMSLKNMDSKEEFTNAWSEIWDIDGFHANNWSSYLVQLKNWIDERKQQRIIRLCHSDGRRPRRPLQTGGDPDDKKDKSFWKALLGDKNENITGTSVDVSHYTKLPIEEIYGQNFSVVALEASYISAGKDTPPNEFPQLLASSDPTHHATLKIGWSHCIALSDVGK